MKRLWIVRHAIAVEHGAPGFSEEERPLTEEGRRRFRKAASGLVQYGAVPEIVVSSPLVRAKETAAILREVLGLEDPVLLCDALAPGGTTASLLGFLGGAGVWREAAVVGHMPGVATLLAELIGVERAMPVEFKKGGAALVGFPSGLAVGAGVLRAFLPPRALRGLAGG